MEQPLPPVLVPDEHDGLTNATSLTTSCRESGPSTQVATKQHNTEPTASSRESVPQTQTHNTVPTTTDIVATSLKITGQELRVDSERQPCHDGLTRTTSLTSSCMMESSIPQLQRTNLPTTTKRIRTRPTPPSTRRVPKQLQHQRSISSSHQKDPTAYSVHAASSVISGLSNCSHQTPSSRRSLRSRKAQIKTKAYLERSTSEVLFTKQLAMDIPTTNNTRRRRPSNTIRKQKQRGRNHVAPKIPVLDATKTKPKAKATNVQPANHLHHHHTASTVMDQHHFHEDNISDPAMALPLMPATGPPPAASSTTAAQEATLEAKRTAKAHHQNLTNRSTTRSSGTATTEGSFSRRSLFHGFGKFLSHSLTTSCKSSKQHPRNTHTCSTNRQHIKSQQPPSDQNPSYIPHSLLISQKSSSTAVMESTESGEATERTDTTVRPEEEDYQDGLNVKHSRCDHHQHQHHDVMHHSFTSTSPSTSTVAGNGNGAPTVSTKNEKKKKKKRLFSNFASSSWRPSFSVSATS